MIQLFKVVSVGSIEPMQKKVDGVLQDMKELSDGQKAVKRMLCLRSTYDFMLDQTSGSTKLLQDTHYVELIGQRAEGCLLQSGDLVLADVYCRPNKEYQRNDVRMGKMYPITLEEL